MLCLFLKGGHISAPGSFIYSLRNKDGLAPFKSTLKYGNAQDAVYRLATYGPSFGGGSDLNIADNAGSNTHSHSNFGHTYILPPGYTSGKTNAKSLLGGSYTFTPSESEVLYLN